MHQLEPVGRGGKDTADVVVAQQDGGDRRELRGALQRLSTLPAILLDEISVPSPHSIFQRHYTVLKSGCRWSDCPEAYGPATTIYNRFARWARRGIWENLFRELAGSGRSTDTQMIDSTHVKAHLLAR